MVFVGFVISGLTILTMNPIQYRLIVSEACFKRILIGSPRVGVDGYGLT